MTWLQPSMLTKVELGYVGFAFQRGAKPLNLTNTCGITVSPTTFSAKTEEYPMGQRMYLYNRTDNLPTEASDFLAYAQSQDADGVIAKSGFIDLGVERLSQNFTGNRMQEIINNTSDQFELGLNARAVGGNATMGTLINDTSFQIGVISFGSKS